MNIDEVLGVVKEALAEADKNTGAVYTTRIPLGAEEVKVRVEHGPGEIQITITDRTPDKAKGKADEPMKLEFTK